MTTSKTAVITTVAMNALFATANVTDLISDWIGIIGGSIGIVVGVFVALNNYERWRQARQERIDNE